MFLYSLQVIRSFMLNGSFFHLLSFLISFLFSNKIRFLLKTIAYFVRLLGLTAGPVCPTGLLSVMAAIPWGYLSENLEIRLLLNNIHTIIKESRILWQDPQQQFSSSKAALLHFFREYFSCFGLRINILLPTQNSRRGRSVI